MNMRLHIDKKLAGLLLFILMLLCSKVEALKDRKFIHHEVVENQHRIMNKDPNPTNEQSDIAKISPPLIGQEDVEKGESKVGNVLTNNKAKSDDEHEEHKDDNEEKPKDDESQNKTTPATKELTFWSGFINSLGMIFFVEFGDRVTFLND